MKPTAFILLGVVALLATAPVIGAPRTTPTTVENSPTVKVDATQNTIKIDATTNTVKSSQNGVWNVGLLDTANTVKANQSGTWNVGILGTANTVKVPAQSQKIQLWTSNQALGPGETATGPTIDTTGFRRINVAVRGNFVGPDVDVWVYVRGGDGTYSGIGAAEFSTDSAPIVQGGSFNVSGSYCVFSLPVISDSMYIRIVNNSAVTATIYDWAYVYMTN